MRHIVPTAHMDAIGAQKSYAEIGSLGTKFALIEGNNAQAFGYEAFQYRGDAKVTFGSVQHLDAEASTAAYDGIATGEGARAFVLEQTNPAKPANMEFGWVSKDPAMPRQGADIPVPPANTNAAALTA